MVLRKGPGEGQEDEEGAGATGDGEKSLLPSSFFRTRLTAPEQPLQLMLTLNLYVCSAWAIFLVEGDFQGALGDDDGGSGTLINKRSCEK